MTNENNETHVITDLPEAKKPNKFRVPFAKKNDSTETAGEETNPKKGKALNGVYTAGLVLLVGGAVAAVASKLTKKSVETEDSDTSADDSDA